MDLEGTGMGVWRAQGSKREAGWHQKRAFLSLQVQASGRVCTGDLGKRAHRSRQVDRCARGTLESEPTGAGRWTGEHGGVGKMGLEGTGMGVWRAQGSKREAGWHQKLAFLSLQVQAGGPVCTVNPGKRPPKAPEPDLCAR